MNPIAKTLIIIGLILVVLGLLWQFGAKVLPLGRLPGDIAIEKDGFRFYFPLATCLVLSGLLSLIFYLMRIFRK